MTAKLFLCTLFIAQNYCNDYSTSGKVVIKIEYNKLESFQNLLQNCVECWDMEYPLRFYDKTGYISIDVTDIVNDDLEMSPSDILAISKSINYE